MQMGDENLSRLLRQEHLHFTLLHSGLRKRGSGGEEFSVCPPERHRKPVLEGSNILQERGGKAQKGQALGVHRLSQLWVISAPVQGNPEVPGVPPLDTSALV